MAVGVAGVLLIDHPVRHLLAPVIAALVYWTLATLAAMTD